MSVPIHNLNATWNEASPRMDNPDCNLKRNVNCVSRKHCTRNIGSVCSKTDKYINNALRDRCSAQSDTFPPGLFIWSHTFL